MYLNKQESFRAWRTLFSFTPMNHASTRARWWLFDLQIPIGRNEEAEAHSQAGCAEYNAFVIRADCIVHFRRKYLKGLLSIPSDGRGARRPQGQSFRESVGPRPCLSIAQLIIICQLTFFFDN